MRQDGQIAGHALSALDSVDGVEGAEGDRSVPVGGRYAIYGDLRERQTLTLATVLHAKRLAFESVEATPSLAWSLASRAGTDRGPFLRTPEGFVLAGLHDLLEYLDRVHPRPELLPQTPVRRICARMLEDWLDLWLPHWPRRSWRSVEGLESHLRAAGFLLGPRPVRADWMLASWLESDVLIHDHARAHLGRAAPRLVSFGDDLLGASSKLGEGAGAAATEDVIPISLLDVLEEIGDDYHAYLTGNHRALKDRETSLELDLGLGLQTLPVQAEAERRRVGIGLEIARLDRRTRRRVAEVLEPVGAWHALRLPPALDPLDPSDPRSL